MQYLILLFSSLPLYIFAYHFLIPVLPDCVDEVPFRPQLPSPQLLLHLRARQKDFSRRYTLDRLHDLLWAVHRHALHQKMHMIFVGPDFQKRDFISLTDLQTDFFKLLVYCGCQDNSSILHWTDKVIHQYRYVMTLVNEATHSHSILSQQAAGN